MSNQMLSAMYEALYEKFYVFTWVHFTKYGVVSGRQSRAYNKSELGVKEY